VAKPIILTVDDEPQVLRAVERDLRRHYTGAYRIVSAASGIEALDAVRGFSSRNDAIALFLADQRMPTMTGTEFLTEARRLYPQARRTLLTAYADTEAAIASINSVGLDYYFMKPWDPPEETLYPVLDGLLEDWCATVPPTYEGIRVAGTLWLPACHRVKDFLARNRIPYQWLDIDKDEQARAMAASADPEKHRLPVVFFPTGEMLVDPDSKTLAEKSGLRIRATQPFYDLIIVGAGPAGLGAAVYGASEGLRTLMIDGEAVGGQAGTSSRIENYLGFPNGLSGAELAQRAEAQARRLGTEILTTQDVIRVRADDSYRFVTLTDGTELGCRALLIATGVTVAKLEAPGVEALTGAGVYYGAALTEAAYYRGERLIVVGGANSAGQAAMFFSQHASTVTMVVRAGSLEKGMSQYLVDQIAATKNIEVLLHTEVVEALGTSRLEGATVANRQTGEAQTLPGAAMFLFIGAVPHSELVAGVVERNGAGFILTGPDLMHQGRRSQNWTLKRDPYLLETSVPGIFAAGDVRQGALRRVAFAVGEGATAVSLIHEYLKTV
jgi:thioredoxin reductase (NADPH)